MDMDFTQARFNMVAKQIRPWNVSEYTLLDILLDIPRELFVTEDQKPLAYAQVALPLSNNSHMLEPAIAARMIQELNIKSTDKVLEIGTGSGYVTAALAKLAVNVTTIDIDAQQQEKAKELLSGTMNLHNISYQVKDGLEEAKPEENTYDAIFVGGSCSSIPEALKNQLSDNGRMIIVTGKQPIMQATLVTRQQKLFKENILFETVIEPLRYTQKQTKPTFSF